MDALPTLPLSAKVTALRGVGPAYATALQEAGIETLRDLLWALPHRYVDRGSVLPIGELDRWHSPGGDRELTTVLGRIKDLRQSTTKVQRMTLVEALVEDGTGTLRLVWFNQAYLTRVLKVGDRVLVFGGLAMGRHGLEMRGPSIEVLGRGGEREENLWVRRFLPLYRKLGPILGRTRARLVQEALRHLHAPQDWLPLELGKGLPTTLDALRLLHQPLDESDPDALELGATPAHRRLASEELFAFALGVAMRRAGRLRRRGLVVPTSEALREKLKAYLPFHLTGAQRTAFRDIVGDLTSGRVMNRLLQGDVGAGKTLVAFLAMAMVAETGGQAALLAPTEVLARQHAATFERLLGEDAHRLQVLLGAMKAAPKREALARIASGEAHYIVGTHALFQESVSFERLQLVVVDEQHRFGVKQREALKEKGGDPHWLVMSATPIPRSLALALFGDLDQSVLDELPPGRQPIRTRLFDPDDAERAWELAERELEAGHQVFVVSPAIDPQDETKVPLRDIQAMEALLRGRFPQVSLAVVHGRLKTEEMAQRMEGFVRGDTRILLATTVIEVGVDVPNATVMVVDHAERFGLSQLHQLRGRVGRGSARSHFLMISASETERLQALVETQDGFRIAQRDLELRGPGEFFGTRQSGLPQFQVADLVRDRGLLNTCREAADRALAHGLGEAQLAWLRQEQARLRLAEIS
nr:ATP-dependent DNA helicase RecG [uncultured Holophaga sp.]